MLQFWRLDKEDDFFLVESPPMAIASKVRAYHLELLRYAHSLRSLSEYQVFELGNTDFDGIAFSVLAKYYEKVANFLQFSPLDLLPESRHRFFIAAERRGDFWISGLEMLMGYDFGGEQTKKDVYVTSGEFEIDLLAELLLLPDTSQIQWLTETKSPQYLMKLIKQMSDRSRGKEAIEELQRERDLQILQKLEQSDLAKQAGF